jgi:putative PIN family toxin of toxin-antitoxin system
MRVVADANILVSAALGRSPAAPSVRIIDAALDGRIEPVMSPALLGEIADVLSRPRIRKRVSPEDAQLFLADVAAQVVMRRRSAPSSEHLPRSRRRLPGCARCDRRRRGAREWG